MTQKDDDVFNVDRQQSLEDGGGGSDAAQSQGWSTPRKEKRSGRYKQCERGLHALFAQHGHISAAGAKRISYGTSRSRRAILKQGFKYLDSVHMCPRKPRNFKPKHMKRLVRHWEDQGLSASTLQLRFSVFSTFCAWVGKHGMLGDITQFLKNPDAARRSYVAKEDKSWSAKGVDVHAKFVEVSAINPRAAMTLKLQCAFALRIEEAALLHPKEADFGSALWVAWGTKGDRDRFVRIETDFQRQVLDEAKTFANNTTGSLVPDGCKLDSWVRRLYKINNRCGISVNDGLVPHGLRHENANNMYENLTGQKSPVRGGEAPDDKKLDKHARRVIAEHLGHSRAQITAHYCGGAKKPKKTDPEKK